MRLGAVCFVAAAATAATALAGCSGGEPAAPNTLLDGSRPAELPVALEGLSKPAVLTNVDVVTGDTAADSSLAACLQRLSPTEPPRRFARRVGVVSESLTFARSSRVFGCDNSPGPRELGRRWCGSSVGRRPDGRLTDPRLNVGCVSSREELMGFVWVELDPDTRYLAVEQEDHVEVYEPAGSLPVRIATADGVELEGSRATFELSEHRADGRVLRSYELEARVAG